MMVNDDMRLNIASSKYELPLHCTACLVELSSALKGKCLEYGSREGGSHPYSELLDGEGSKKV